MIKIVAQGMGRKTLKNRIIAPCALCLSPFASLLFNLLMK
jgi:hypothetical protein